MTPAGLEPATNSLEARRAWSTYRCVLKDLQRPETVLCGALCGLRDPAAAVPGVGSWAAAILSNSSCRRRSPSLRRSIASRCRLVWGGAPRGVDYGPIAITVASHADAESAVRLSRRFDRFFWVATTSPSQRWLTFLRNHSTQIAACTSSWLRTSLASQERSQ